MKKLKDLVETLKNSKHEFDFSNRFDSIIRESLIIDFTMNQLNYTKDSLKYEKTNVLIKDILVSLFPSIKRKDIKINIKQNLKSVRLVYENIYSLLLMYGLEVEDLKDDFDLKEYKTQIATFSIKDGEGFCSPSVSEEFLNSIS
jgi:hypothetical protein